MKRCPKCSRTYSEDKFKYCLDDGSVLVRDDPQPTLLMPPPQPRDPKPIKTLVGSPTQLYNEFPDSQRLAGSPTSPYQTQNPRTRWPLYVSLAVFLLFIGGGATALLLVF